MAPAERSSLHAEIRATLRLAGPLVLANLLQMAVYSIDVIFVARLGEQALAASSLAVSICGLLMFALSSLTGSLTPLIAAERGRRWHAVREIRTSLRMALWLAAICAVAGTLLCQFARPFFVLTGQDPVVSARAQDFLALLSFSLLPMLAGSVLRNFVSAMGRPVFATMVTALAIVCNALGNWVFVYGHWGAPALGLEGSAISSILTTTIALIAYVLAITRDRRLRRYRVFGRLWRPEWRRLGELIRIGVPIGLTVVAEGGLFSSAAFLMGRIGEAELAAHTIALQIAAFFFQVPFGIGQAATIRVGYCFGAGDRAGVARAGAVALGVALVFQLVSATIMLAAPRLVLSVYVDAGAPANTALVMLAVHYLAVAAAFQLFDGIQAVAAGALRGLQDTRVPMAMAIAGYWIVGFSIAVGLGLATPLGGFGVWIGLAAGLVAVAAMLLWRWRRREALRLVL